MNFQSTNRSLICLGLAVLVGGWFVGVASAEGENDAAQTPAAQSDNADTDANPVKKVDPFAKFDPAEDPYGARRIPDALVDIGVDDSNNGNVLDFNTAFRDHKNNLVRIGDLFDGTKPVIMSFNYSDCPKLCSVQLENMVDTLSQIDLKIGTDFRMVSISIDPKETTQRAQQSLEIYTKQYNLSEARSGFHFLVGEEASIKQLTDEVGFKFKYIERQKRFSHPPLFVIVSPKGKLVRYIHGLDYDPSTMKLALVEAAEGRIGSPLNYASYGLGCFVFDEKAGKYTFQAMALMRGGALLTILALVFTLVPYWLFSKGNEKESRVSGSEEKNILSEPELGT